MNGHHALAWLLTASILLCAGCGDEARPAGQASLWTEAGAPDDLLTLLDDLQAYQTTTGHLPSDLTQLDLTRLATGGPYAQRGYAYRPAGIGVLREGWRVIAADDRRRDPQRVWCLVRPPARLTGQPSMRAVLVPLGELREAAVAAGGKKD
jgi:hypothetical protein